MRIPRYRKHSSGRAFYEHEGQRHYLPGAYNSAESRTAYKQFLAKLCRVPEPMDKPALIAVLCEQWLRHCEGYYGGVDDGEYKKCFYAVRELQPYLGNTPAEFGPKKLKEVQAAMAKRKLTRKYINATVHRIRRMFEWGVSEELIDASIHHALSAVRGLAIGRTMAKESIERQPVPWEHVRPVLPHVKPAVRAMILMQWHTGARSKSIRLARPEQFKIDVTPWEWRPQHKTEHLGKKLVVFLGPKAREVLQDRLAKTPTGGYLFVPTTSRTNHRYGKFYSRNSYAQAVARGIDRANKHRAIDNEHLPEGERLKPIPRWSPHQIRHTKGTSVRAKHGLEAAQATLGHETIDAAQIYAQRQMDTARRIGEEEG